MIMGYAAMDKTYYSLSYQLPNDENHKNRYLWFDNSIDADTYYLCYSIFKKKPIGHIATDAKRIKRYEAMVKRTRNILERLIKFETCGEYHELWNEKDKRKQAEIKGEGFKNEYK